jgi:dTDP-4-amino-4,6-dideoxygalactose transaminase
MIDRPLLRFLPPAGHPIAFRNVFRAVLDSYGQEEGSFADALKSYLGIKNCYLVSSGTAALYTALKAIGEDTDRDEVVIPAYCCPSLVASAARAGMKVRLCDIAQSSFDFDLQQLSELVTSKTLCVVAVHLFGIPLNLTSTMGIASPTGTLVIEDSAQAFGIDLDGAKLGTIGDIGFYSFGRGKSLTMLGGGAIVTNRHSVALKIEGLVDTLEGDSLLSNISSFAKVMLYSLFVHPNLYWIPNSLPLLGLGKTEYVSDFKTESLCKYLEALGAVCVALNDSISRERSIRAGFLVERLTQEGVGSFSIPGAHVGIPYLRLPVVCRSPHLRDEVLKALVRAGIGATPMYGGPLSRIPGVTQNLTDVRDYPNAEHIAARLLTLPVTPFVAQKDLDTMAQIFKTASRGGEAWA